MNPFQRETSSTHVLGLIGLGVVGALLATTATAQEEEGGWKPRVQHLEAELAALQRKQLPVEANVDCGSGGSIGETLAANAEGGGLLTIRITGTCVENIRISRSNVVLEGQTGAAIQAAPGATFIVNVDNNVNHVTIRDLTIAGTSSAAVVVQKGAHAVVRNAVLRQSGAGAMALDNGVLDVTGSTLTANNNGAYAARGGVVSVSNSTIQGNSIGVLAWKAGTVILTSSLPDFSEPGVGPIVQGNTTGIAVRSGGFLELADATIQGNAQNGVVVDSGGAVHFFSQLNGSGTRVTANGNAGVLALKNSSVVFSDTTTVITGNVRGIMCAGNPSYLAPPGFTVSGNLAGDILGCTP